MRDLSFFCDQTLDQFGSGSYQYFETTPRWRSREVDQMFDSTPRDDRTGWERAPFACGCGRGCVSWPDHHARVEAEAVVEDRRDVADDIDAKRERES